MALNVRIKIFLLLSLLLLIPLSSGMVEGFKFKGGMDPYYSLHKVGIQMNTRKLLLDVQDYDDAGANCKHDRRKPCGGKSP